MLFLYPKAMQMIIFGNIFFKNYYTIYDLQNQRVGLVPAINSEVDQFPSSIGGVINYIEYLLGNDLFFYFFVVCMVSFTCKMLYNLLKGD